MTRLLDAIPGWAWCSLVLLISAGCADAWWGLQKANRQLADYRQTAALAQARARQTEYEAALKIEENTHQLTKAHHAAEKRIQAALARHRAGTERLSIPAAGCTPPSADATPAQPDPQARAELDGQTAETLVTIAADGDRAIRQLNACVDSYNAVRALINHPDALPLDAAKAP